MPDGYDYATECRYCGTTYYPNMYGMGTCSGCGYSYHPVDPIVEMHKNENWHPPKKEQPVETVEPVEQSDPQHCLAIVASAIVAGKLDNDLKDLEALILERIKTRKNQVMALVQEVYGENYTITGTRSK